MANWLRAWRDWRGGRQDGLHASAAGRRWIPRGVHLADGTLSVWSR
ncbi:MAG: hypothetical protein WBP22_01755 [Candidatus Saccharimonas sp.]